MDTTGLQIEVRTAWWYEAYVYGVLFMALTFGLEPNWVKVYDVTARAIRFRFAGGTRWHRLVD